LRLRLHGRRASRDSNPGGSVHIELKLDGSTNWPGTYSLDLSTLNGREYNWVKKIANVRLGELFDAMEAGDYDLTIAFTVIALVRDGKIPKETAIRAAEMLAENIIGSIASDFVADDEDDARPPDETTSSSDESSPSSSTPSSEPLDAPSETNPPPIGSPEWASALSNLAS